MRSPAVPRPVALGVFRSALVLLLAAPVCPLLAGEKTNVETTAHFLSFNVGHVKSTKGGIVHITGMTCVNRLQPDETTSNPLLTGRLTWTGKFNGDTELNGGGSGTGLIELGTWDKETGTVFTPAPDGGAFVTTWHGSGNLVGGYEVKVVGHGIAGRVKGMQLQLVAKGDLNVTKYEGQLLNPKAKK